MNIVTLQKNIFLSLLIMMFFSIQTIHCQEENETTQEETKEAKKKLFWSKVKFGGNVGLGVSGNTFNAVIAPTAIYNFNPYIGLGTGLHFGYTDGLNFTATNYGASIIGLLNPITGLQLSAEFEQMGVSRSIEIEEGSISNTIDENYWYPALFFGAGYQIGPVITGLRYDVLYKDNESIYASAFAPFVRILF